MRVPLSWVEAFVPLATPTDDIAEQLTCAGIEVEAIGRIGALDPRVVVAQLDVCEPVTEHVGIHRLEVSIVEEGEPRTVNLVTGAPDVGPIGIKLAVALPGATLIDPKADGFALFEIEARTVCSHPSEGAVCSSRELGIGANHTGLHRLPDDAPVGAPVRTVLDRRRDWAADEILELAILPNIARCQSIVGVSREIAALTGRQPDLALDLADLEFGGGGLAPIISEPELCKGFCVAEVRGVSVGPSPDWLRRRLVLAGYDPKNNVVDAINYAMVEMGQPMHAYDAARLPEKRLSARMANPGEKLHFLTQDEAEAARELPEGALVIASGSTPVALAGVVGGTETAVRAETTEILIEAANFELLAIRRSQRLSKVFTESSARFSRGVDPKSTTIGVRRVLAILLETCPELEVVETGLTIAEPQAPRQVELSLDELEDAMGARYQPKEVVDVLDRMGVKPIYVQDRNVVVTSVDSSRNDIERPCDLMEEVARLVGFDRVPETMPRGEIPPHPGDEQTELREHARDLMVRAGLQEVVTYTLNSPEVEARLATEPNAGAEGPYLRLLNPINSARTVMRRTLLGGLLQCVQYNLRFTDACHVFEIGVVVHPETCDDEGLPRELLRLGIALTGPVERKGLHGNRDREADFFDGGQAIETLMESLHVPSWRFDRCERAPYQPGRCARVVGPRGEPYGFFGELHPRIAATFDLEQRLVCGEFDLGTIIGDRVRFFQARTPGRFPSIEVDISMFLDEPCPSEQVTEIVRKSGGPLVASARVIDLFAGRQVPDGQKALTVGIELNAGDRSLTMEEARNVRGEIARVLSELLGAQVRE